MRSKVQTDVTDVIRMGMDTFTVDREDNEVQVTESASQMSTEDTQSPKIGKRIKKDGRFYGFVKKHFLHRRKNANGVQEISILPEGDELKWARRSAGSAVSRSSGETGSSEEDRLEVVHDMADDDVLADL